MTYVYKTTNSKNGKFYIGVHSGEENDGYLGSGVVLRKAIEKYGKENFKREIIKEFDNINDAFELEKELVTEDLVNSTECYNQTLGGYGGFYHIDNYGDNNPMRNPDVVQKVFASRSFTLKQNPEKYSQISRNNLQYAYVKNIGTTRSEETKRKIGEGIKAFYRINEHPKKGIPDTPETRQRKSESWTEDLRKWKSEQQRNHIESNNIDMGLRRGAKTSEETKRKQSEAARKNWHNVPFRMCPHCGKESRSLGNLKRWHFDNCKHRKHDR